MNTTDALKNLFDALKLTGFNCAYHHFDKPVALPFVVYATDGADDFYADGGHYAEAVTGYVEFYSGFRDFEGEETVKAALASVRGLVWRKAYDDFIEDEKMYVSRWRFQILI